MEQLEKWKNWLLGFPGLGGCLHLDHTGPELGSTGLFPVGSRVLHRQEDVLGNRYVRYRYTCQLRRVDTYPNGYMWLAKLMSWAQIKIGCGELPGLGNLPGEETISTRNCRIEKHDPGGTDTYCIDLIAEYTVVYPAG